MEPRYYRYLKHLLLLVLVVHTTQSIAGEQDQIFGLLWRKAVTESSYYVNTCRLFVFKVNKKALQTKPYKQQGVLPALDNFHLKLHEKVWNESLLRRIKHPFLGTKIGKTVGKNIFRLSAVWLHDIAQGNVAAPPGMKGLKSSHEKLVFLQFKLAIMYGKSKVAPMASRIPLQLVRMQGGKGFTPREYADLRKGKALTGGGPALTLPEITQMMAIRFVWLHKQYLDRLSKQIGGVGKVED